MLNAGVGRSEVDAGRVTEVVVGVGKMAAAVAIPPGTGVYRVDTGVGMDPWDGWLTGDFVPPSGIEAVGVEASELTNGNEHATNMLNRISAPIFHTFILQTPRQVILACSVRRK